MEVLVAISIAFLSFASFIAFKFNSVYNELLNKTSNVLIVILLLMSAYYFGFSNAYISSMKGQKNVELANLETKEICAYVLGCVMGIILGIHALSHLYDYIKDKKEEP